MTIDNIPLPVYGKQEALFFELSHEPEVVPSAITEFEEKSEQEKAQLTISVFKGDQIPKITNQILYKLSKYSTLKVIASGFTIITAVRATLQVVTSDIAIEPVGVSAIFATSIARRDNPSKKIPAIHIYLEKGHSTVYPLRHSDVLTQIVHG